MQRIREECRLTETDSVCFTTSILFAHPSFFTHKKQHFMSNNSDPFNGPQIQGQHYQRANMAMSNFDGVNLAESRFFAVLSDAIFNDTNLARASFDDVNLGAATFNNINLQDATFDNINFSNVKISNANLSGMSIDGILVSDLLAAYKKLENSA